MPPLGSAYDGGRYGETESRHLSIEDDIMTASSQDETFEPPKVPPTLLQGLGTGGDRGAGGGGRRKKRRTECVVWTYAVQACVRQDPEHMASLLPSRSNSCSLALWLSGCLSLSVTSIARYLFSGSSYHSKSGDRDPGVSMLNSKKKVRPPSYADEPRRRREMRKGSTFPSGHLPRNLKRPKAKTVASSRRVGKVESHTHTYGGGRGGQGKGILR